MRDQEEQKKRDKRDLAYDWVTSSAFLFYLQVACIIALLFGSCYMLYTKRFSPKNVEVQESTRYTPVYK